MNFTKIARNEKLLYQLTGLNSKQLWYFVLQHKFFGPKRGRKFSVDFVGMVICHWMYLRHYVTMEFLSIVCYGRDKSTVSRHGAYVRKVLQHLTLPENNKGNGLGQEEILYVIRDVTESKCSRSKDYDTQKEHYSGKKKSHTFKTEAVISPKKIILQVSDTTPGSVHDFTIAQKNPLDKAISLCPQKVDKGYAGLQKEYPDSIIEMPKKKSKNHPLSESDKIRNQMIGRDRVKVEHVFAEAKVFQCLSQRRRSNNIQYYQQDINLIFGVMNMRKA
jgi:hypothetical protein